MTYSSFFCFHASIRTRSPRSIQSITMPSEYASAKIGSSHSSLHNLRGAKRWDARVDLLRFLGRLAWYGRFVRRVRSLKRTMWIVRGGGGSREKRTRDGQREVLAEMGQSHAEYA